MKVLVIEDHEDVSSFIRRGLQYEKFVVDVASDGEIALEKIKVNDYDIFILDLLLPKIDGVDLLRQIRENGNNTPVLVLTAIQDFDTKVNLLNIGADDYLEKPFSFNELLARIQAILRRSQGLPKKSAICLEDLTLDPITREVTRQDKKIFLRTKEFTLLEYFLNHVGQVISATTLLEQVWDFNADVLSNTVQTHIASLRKKIDSGFKKKLIKTIHGAGYKISAS